MKKEGKRDEHESKLFDFRKKTSSRDLFDSDWKNPLNIHGEYIHFY